MEASGSAAISAVRRVFGNDGFGPILEVEELRISGFFCVWGTAAVLLIQDFQRNLLPR